MSLSTEHLAQLTAAKSLLQGSGLAQKIGAMFGIVCGRASDTAPNRSDDADALAHDTLMLGLRGMLMTFGVGDDPFPPLPRFAAAMRVQDRGANPLGLALELPVSMMLMCRSIADIARANGERIENVRARFACLEPFAFGDVGEGSSGYLAARADLVESSERAARYLSDTLIVDDESPELHAYIAAIAARFGRQIEAHIAADAELDIVAHYSSAANVLLIDHFLDIARGHFVVRRLERLYGPHDVRTTYERIKRTDV
jgi:hypothetical protein